MALPSCDDDETVTEKYETGYRKCQDQFMQTVDGLRFCHP
jgi:hypothetical protein